MGLYSLAEEAAIKSDLSLLWRLVERVGAERGPEISI